VTWKRLQLGLDGAYQILACGNESARTETCFAPAVFSKEHVDGKFPFYDNVVAALCLRRIAQSV
jgi:hypothetical protein